MKEDIEYWKSRLNVMENAEPYSYKMVRLYKLSTGELITEDNLSREKHKAFETINGMGL